MEPKFINLLVENDLYINISRKFAEKVILENVLHLFILKYSTWLYKIILSIFLLVVSVEIDIITAKPYIPPKTLLWTHTLALKLNVWFILKHHISNSRIRPIFVIKFLSKLQLYKTRRLNKKAITTHCTAINHYKLTRNFRLNRL